MDGLRCSNRINPKVLRVALEGLSGGDTCLASAADFERNLY